MRFHILSLPHTQTTKQYSWCAYTQKVRKFCDMMTSLGHEVFLYAGEENEAKCTELVPVLSTAEVDSWFGHLNWETDLFPADGWEPAQPWWKTANSRAITEIAKRREPGDFLGVIMGRSQQEVADAFPDMLPCEWGIGYEGTFSNYRVFESYAWMHHVYGIQRNSNGIFYDEVIPNSFEVKDFPLGDGAGEYYLFLGRVILRKGPHVAAEVCAHLKQPLVVAGQGVWKQEPGRFYGIDNVVLEHDDMEYVGVVQPQERAKLLGGAKAVFMPTLYIEPFGGVAVEAMLCGTPVIATDWGAFTETIQNGVNGYRCRSFRDFVEAAHVAPDLNRRAIRNRAIDLYSTDTVRHQYDAYFRRLNTLRGDGWYDLSIADTA